MSGVRSTTNVGDMRLPLLLGAAWGKPVCEGVSLYIWVCCFCFIERAKNERHEKVTLAVVGIISSTLSSTDWCFYHCFGSAHAVACPSLLSSRARGVLCMLGMRVYLYRVEGDLFFIFLIVLEDEGLSGRASQAA